MKSSEIRQKFLNFFEKREHSIIPSVSLVPENDPSVLFITAGMQPLVPYLMGESHPKGKRLASVQKCVRTQDIEEVGDRTHDTFFEMLGNWSLGDYFKEEAIKWSYELLTSEEGFNLNPEKLYVTVFAGNNDAPRDEESAEIWKSVGVPEDRIFYLEDNWWSPGDNGPCGPDSEMFYNISGEDLDIKTLEDFKRADDEQKIVEIWNDVFMEYEKKDGKVIGKLAQRNVDTGAGLERLAMVLQEKDNIFDTDLFAPLMPIVQTLSEDEVSQRIIADHYRTAIFMIADGVLPSNTDQGYILRRLLRRAMTRSKNRDIDNGQVSLLVNAVIDNYFSVYENLKNKGSEIKAVIEKENESFKKAIETGMRAFEKGEKDVFKLVTTYGLPLDFIKEIMDFDEEDLAKKIQEHQEKSRAGAEQKFKGGLADHSEMSVKYHTATHLLHQALRDVLGEHVVQKGSNITPERLRFDFTHGEKMTDEEKASVEELVNQKIKEGIEITKEEMTLEEAKASGAIGLFGEKYGDTVSVYKVGDYSTEFCGGPHVSNTNELGNFKIKKEEASSAGVRRIKAVLE